MPLPSVTHHDLEQQALRLRRIEGQVRGLQRMVAEDRGCLEILAQVAAVTHALQAVAVALASRHLRKGTQAATEEADGDLHCVPADTGRMLAQLLRT